MAQGVISIKKIMKIIQIQSNNFYLLALFGNKSNIANNSNNINIEEKKTIYKRRK